MEGELVELTRMRAGIARRMVESKRQAPHFYVQTEVVMNRVVEQLQHANSNGSSVKISVTAPLIRACVEALRAQPMFNGIWTDEGPLVAEEVNIGVAIALEDGVLAPAVLGADRLGLAELATALRNLAERARQKRLTPNEMSDATFTLSNLGMFDVSAFTAIIPPPQIAILATGRPVERWVLRNGEPTCQSVMTATLSADHRAVDGVAAARFLETFKKALEDLDLRTTDTKEGLQ